MSLSLSDYTSKREEEYLRKRRVTYEDSNGESSNILSDLMSMVIAFATAGMVYAEGSKNYTSTRSVFVDDDYYVPAPRIISLNEEAGMSKYNCVEWRWLK